MRAFSGWSWKNTFTPRTLVHSRNQIVKIEKIHCINPGMDLDKMRKHPVVFITGDGKTLPDEVREFESWGVPHDLYCVNRSLLYFQRQVDHWAAIDIEESAWFSEYVSDDVCPERPIHRHTIGECTIGYDIYWERDFPFEHDYQKRIWIGNTGYFATLTAVEMGYEKVVLAGMPLDNKSHFYDQDELPGPTWTPICFTQWMDFKMKRPEVADKVRSMGGYSAFMLGTATKEWVEDNAAIRQPT